MVLSLSLQLLFRRRPCQSLPNRHSKQEGASRENNRGHHEALIGRRRLLSCEESCSQVSPLMYKHTVSEWGCDVLVDLIVCACVGEFVVRSRCELRCCVLISTTASHHFHLCVVVVVRDLKPQNVMFLSDDDNAPLQIIDFGTAVCAYFRLIFYNQQLYTAWSVFCHISMSLLESACYRPIF